MAWSLRPVRALDLEVLRRTVWQSVDDAYAPRKLAHLLANMAQHTALALAVWHEDDLIGYGQVMRWRTCAEIADLFVVETWRNRGIGTVLVQRLREEARTWGITCVEIGVAVQNTRAHALYLRLGFQWHHTLALPTGEELLYLRTEP